MLSPIEHKLLADLKVDRPQGKWLCAVSGGVDSVAGMVLLQQLARLLKLELVVAHVHHGPSQEREVRKYRLQAFMRVAQLAEQMQLPFLNRTSPEDLQSEAQLRQFRYQALTEMRTECGARGVVTFHHQEDLLETRLIRLLRGVGPKGLVAMSRRKPTLWRPFLHVSKQLLVDYALEKNVVFVDDPSNSSTRYLRNWLRTTWLKPLMRDHPEKLEILARSLEQLCQSPTFDGASCWDPRGGIKRRVFNVLSQPQQKQVLVQHLRTLVAAELRSSQYQEILRQLDKNAIEHTFKVAGLICSINAERIWFENQA